MLTNSILATVRAMCNVEETDSGFDKQLIPLINGQLMMAHEFGVGNPWVVVSDESKTWNDLLGEHTELFDAFKTWLGYSVLLLFDPPDNSTVLKSYQDQSLKMEWMLCNKACLEGAVKDFVPEKADFYENIGERTSSRRSGVYYERIAEATVDED